MPYGPGPQEMEQREQFLYKFGCQFYHETLISAEQCALQIYIKQAMTTSKLYTKFSGSLINACCSLIFLVFLCFGMT